MGILIEAMKAALPEACSDLTESVYTHVGPGAVTHLFRVTAGLESMVVGEQEIIRQVRTALSASSQVSPKLRRAFQGALTTAKAIITQTELGAVTRSLASVGLDLAGFVPSETDPTRLALPPWNTSRVVILGTGQYAGTVVADLSRRGCTNMLVYSGSGNAHVFAQTHPVQVASDLTRALKTADLLVAASGNGGVKVTEHILRGARTKVIVDLSGGVDLGENLPIRVIGLTEIGSHAPPACKESVDQAEKMVADGVAELLQYELGRGAAPAITAMRGYVTGIIDAEVDRARHSYPPETALAIEKALHRVTGAMLHHPSVAAVELARIGRMDEYNQALETLFGILVEV